MPSKKTSRPGGKDRSDDVEVVLREIIGDVPMHRRLLEHLNHAVRADDLAFAPLGVVRGDGALFPDHDLDEPRRALLPLDVAEAVLELRDEYFPLGFRHVIDVRNVFDPERWRWLLEWLSRRSKGSWSDFAQRIPRRGPGHYDGIVHAAVLHTGDVLFITRCPAGRESPTATKPDCGARQTSRFVKPRGVSMSKYLIRGNYVGNGIAGLRKDGGAKRLAAATAALESVGGTLDCFYYAFGDTDLFGIVDAPDDASAFNASLLINSSGAVNVTLTPLFDPSVISAGASGSYSAPGQ